MNHCIFSKIGYLRAMKIGIVGCGQVGMAAASSLFQQGLISELILIDKDQNKTKGEALDLMHAQGYVGRCSVSYGEYSDLSDVSYIVFTAGVSQEPGENRLDLLGRNLSILKLIIKKLDKYCPNAILIIATNPVDILTYFAGEYSSRNLRKIIGTGTMLDTSRFRSLLGEHFNIDPRSVHAYVVGEHGNSEVLLWSSAMIAGQKVVNNPILEKEISFQQKNDIENSVVNAAYDIIEKKGYTSWAIGLVISYLISVIENDQKSILPLSVRTEGDYGIEDSCMGLPCIVGKEGIERKISLTLSDEESLNLKNSGKILAEIISSLKIKN